MEPCNQDRLNWVKDVDPEQNKDVVDAESSTSEQQINLLADPSQISEATVKVERGALPLLFTKGAILPASLMASDYRVDNSNVTLGTLIEM